MTRSEAEALGFKSSIVNGKHVQAEWAGRVMSVSGRSLDDVLAKIDYYARARAAPMRPSANGVGPRGEGKGAARRVASTRHALEGALWISENMTRAQLPAGLLASVAA